MLHLFVALLPCAHIFDADLMPLLHVAALPHPLMYACICQAHDADCWTSLHLAVMFEKSSAVLEDASCPAGIWAADFDLWSDAPVVVALLSALQLGPGDTLSADVQVALLAALLAGQLVALFAAPLLVVQPAVLLAAQFASLFLHHHLVMVVLAHRSRDYQMQHLLIGAR